MKKSMVRVSSFCLHANTPIEFRHPELHFYVVKTRVYRGICSMCLTLLFLLETIELCSKWHILACCCVSLCCWPVHYVYMLVQYAVIK